MAIRSRKEALGTPCCSHVGTYIGVRSSKRFRSQKRHLRRRLPVANWDHHIFLGGVPRACPNAAFTGTEAGNSDSVIVLGRPPGSDLVELLAIEAKKKQKKKKKHLLCCLSRQSALDNRRDGRPNL